MTEWHAHPAPCPTSVVIIGFVLTPCILSMLGHSGYLAVGSLCVPAVCHALPPWQCRSARRKCLLLLGGRATSRMPAQLSENRAPSLCFPQLGPSCLQLCYIEALLQWAVPVFCLTSPQVSLLYLHAKQLFSNL